MKSIYDPTCGSGECSSPVPRICADKARSGNVRLYRRTKPDDSSIAWMNCFPWHRGFRIERATRYRSQFVQGDRLMQFDGVGESALFHQAVTDAFASDSWGRNLYGRHPVGQITFLAAHCAASSPRPVVAPFCFRTAFSSVRKKRTCGKL